MEDECSFVIKVIYVEKELDGNKKHMLELIWRSYNGWYKKWRLNYWQMVLSHDKDESVFWTRVWQKSQKVLVKHQNTRKSKIVTSCSLSSPTSQSLSFPLFNNFPFHIFSNGLFKAQTDLYKCKNKIKKWSPKCYIRARRCKA